MQYSHLTNKGFIYAYCLLVKLISQWDPNWKEQIEYLHLKGMFLLLINLTCMAFLAFVWNKEERDTVRQFITTPFFKKNRLDRRSFLKYHAWELINLWVSLRFQTLVENTYFTGLNCTSSIFSTFLWLFVKVWESLEHGVMTFFPILA